MDNFDLTGFFLFLIITYLLTICCGHLSKVLKYFEKLLHKNQDLIHDSRKKSDEYIIPKSVNYHFTRKCNYSCGFCFHTAKTSYVLKLDDTKIGLKMLKDSGEFFISYFS